MPDWVPAVVVGIILIVLAVGLAWQQWVGWKRGSAGLLSDDEARQHAARQFRRRLQVSVMLGIVGLMIPLGDLLPVFRQSPQLFVIYWLIVLAAVVWIVLLALGDLASNLAYSRVARNRLRRERRTLEDELRAYRSQTNGRHQDDSSS